ncbi:pitrilysin family protein [Algivirga pacifica]|uniref:Pitrilysin family protein n=1 Tax=Algivirga pacifica TaxID=1162670 RepID=A0ABP9DQ58_9BACT
MLDRTTPPIAYSVSDFPLAKPVKTVLKNGIELYALDVYPERVLTLQLIFKGGRLIEKQKGEATFAGKMLVEGTSTMSSSELSEKLEYYGASVTAHSSYDHFTVEVHVMNQYLLEVCQILMDILTESAFPDEDFEHIRNIVLQNKKVNEEKNNVLATRHFQQAIYGKEHPYTYDLSIEEIQAFSKDAAKHYYDVAIKGQPFTVFCAGFVKEEDIDVLNRTVGTLSVSAKSIEPAYPSFVELTASKKVYLEKDNAVQTAVRVGRTTFGIESRERTAFGVTNEILGGYFGSRLMKNLREHKGMTYGVYAGKYNTKQQGFFMVAADVQKSRKEEAFTEIYKELELLVNESVKQEELALVKNYMIGRFVMSINSYTSILTYMKQLYLNGYAFDYYDHYVNRVNQVTVEQVKEIAEKYYRGPFVEVGVG